MLSIVLLERIWSPHNVCNENIACSAQVWNHERERDISIIQKEIAHQGVRCLDSYFYFLWSFFKYIFSNSKIKSSLGGLMFEYFNILYICFYLNTRPVSAYALFFRDTQASIKVKNPNASFGEVSKLVASMWDGLNQDTKNVSRIFLKHLYWGLSGIYQYLPDEELYWRFSRNSFANAFDGDKHDCFEWCMLLVGGILRWTAFTVAYSGPWFCRNTRSKRKLPRKSISNCLLTTRPVLCRG